LRSLESTNFGRSRRPSIEAIHASFEYNWLKIVSERNDGFGRCRLDVQREMWSASSEDCEMRKAIVPSNGTVDVDRFGMTLVLSDCG
jgi:hypothetical protein